MEKITDVVYDNYQGRCEFCGEPIAKSSAIYHHLQNRCDKGPTSVENLCPRHVDCENYCHYHYNHGNPSEGLVNNHYYKEHKSKQTKKRRHNRKVRNTNRYQKSRRYAS